MKLGAVEFPIKNPLSSSSKNRTTLAPEPRNDSTRSQNQCWPHVGLYDIRGYTCEKLSFIDVKRWVVENPDFGAKNVHEKPQTKK